jgi:uncharacterized phage protein gp47/JayE
MATLPTKDFPTLVSDQATAIQAYSSQTLDLSIGSVELSLIETTSGVAFWIQDLIVALLAVTRASTSKGHDLDTFVEDYGLERNPAVAATGNVTFSRTTATQQAVVVVGTQVSTVVGSEIFAVTADSTNPNFNPALNGYVLTPGTTSISVPVQAVVAGAAGNVSANTITLILQGIPGVTNVTNPAAFTNGLDEESDPSLRKRFVDYINSLSKATKGAVQFAVESVNGVTDDVIVENQDINGNTDLGYFYVVIDDGTGNPSNTLIQSVTNAVDAVRPLTVAFGVYGPEIVNIDITATITPKPGFEASDLITAATNALTNFINDLIIGDDVIYSELYQVIYNSSTTTNPDGSITTNFANVQNLLLNGGTSDVVITNKQTAKPQTITIT